MPPGSAQHLEDAPSPLDTGRPRIARPRNNTLGIRCLRGMRTRIRCLRMRTRIRCLRGMRTRIRCLRGMRTRIRCLRGMRTRIRCLRGMRTRIRCLRGMRTRIRCLRGMRTRIRCLRGMRTRIRCLRGMRTRITCLIAQVRKLIVDGLVGRRLHTLRIGIGAVIRVRIIIGVAVGLGPRWSGRWRLIERRPMSRGVDVS
jgi:hypothetical protein